MTQETQIRMWNFDQPLSHFEVLCAFEKAGTWYTRLQIAQNLRRSKSPSLIVLLTDLVADGFLHIDRVALPNRVDMWVYQLTERGCDAILHGGLPPRF